MSLEKSYLRNYQQTNYKKLFEITKALFENNELNQSLTPEQCIVIENILDIVQNKNGSALSTTNTSVEIPHGHVAGTGWKIWEAFLVGKLKLKVVKMETVDKKSKNKSIDDNNGANATSTGNNADGKPNNTTTETKDKMFETDFSEIDLLNLQDQLSGHDFIANLSLKLRYIIWEKPLSNTGSSITIDQSTVQPHVQGLMTTLLKKNQSYLDEELDSKITEGPFASQKQYLITSLEGDKDNGVQNTLETTNHTYNNESALVNTSEKRMDDNYDDEVDDDYDDDYDNEDEDYDKEQQIDPLASTSNETTSTLLQLNGETVPAKQIDATLVDSDGFYTLDLEISKKTLKKLKINNIDSIMGKFNTIYHSLENDKDTVLKRLKLEQNDQLIENSKKRKLDDQDVEGDGISNGNDNNNNKKKSLNNGVQFASETNNNQENGNSSNEKKMDDEPSDNSKSPSKPTSQFSLLSNLPIQNLLGAIQEGREQVSLSDYELKHLLLDVRKSRSKWASDDKIGQEELYEACEKVVMQLRNFTEHSTAFLNKVSKRDAPNYYNIIKKPMDLNTVLKKLKTFQYVSKQDFVDDLNLIWKNCFTYNSDSKHFLRAHALAMQKKASTIIPHIPDITVRDRSEVEKDLDEPLLGQNAKDGINGVSQENSNKTTDTAIAESKTGGNGSVSDTEKKGAGKNTTTHAISKDQADSVLPGDMLDKNTDLSDITGEEPVVDGIKQENPTSELGVARDSEPEDSEDDEEAEGLSQYLTEQDNHKDDLELSMWKSLTSNARAEICIERSKLFDGYKLNNKATALLRNRKKMKLQSDLVNEYKERREIELMNKHMKDNSMLKNGFNSAMLYDEDEDMDEATEQKKMKNNKGKSDGNAQTDMFKTEDLNSAENSDSEDDEEEEQEEEQVNIEVDDLAFLNEYNVANNLPSLKYPGISNADLNSLEDALVAQELDKRKYDPAPTRSCFLSQIDQGMSPKINVNIQLTQEIRHICHKIFLIRQLQTRQNMVPTKNNPNPMNFTPTLFRTRQVDSQIDIDQVSQLPTRNFKYDATISKAVLFKVSSKLAMNSGFESTEKSAIHMLNDIADDYLSNLIKTLKVHSESISSNKLSLETMLEVTLLQSGVTKPDELYSYYEKEFSKKTRKLKDIKYKLNVFLKQLLRPSLKGLSERNFDDESTAFVTGEYSSEITGEDFFGFKELGLDKEFSMLNKSIPLHLLAFQLGDKSGTGSIKEKKIQQEELEGIEFHKLTKDDCDKKRYFPELMKDLFVKQYEISKRVVADKAKQAEEEKLAESQGDASSEVTTEQESQPDVHDNIVVDVQSKDFHILEDMELPNRTKFTRLPPTGKIPNVKKKLLREAFFLPESLKVKLEQEKKELEMQRLEDLEREKQAKEVEKETLQEDNKKTKDPNSLTPSSTLVLPPSAPNKYGLTLPPSVTNSAT